MLFSSILSLAQTSAAASSASLSDSTFSLSHGSLNISDRTLKVFAVAAAGGAVLCSLAMAAMAYKFFSSQTQLSKSSKEEIPSQLQAIPSSLNEISEIDIKVVKLKQIIEKGYSEENLSDINTLDQAVMAATSLTQKRDEFCYHLFKLYDEDKALRFFTILNCREREKLSRQLVINDLLSPINKIIPLMDNQEMVNLFKILVINEKDEQALEVALQLHKSEYNCQGYLFEICKIFIALNDLERAEKFLPHLNRENKKNINQELHERGVYTKTFSSVEAQTDEEEVDHKIDDARSPISAELTQEESKETDAFSKELPLILRKDREPSVKTLDMSVDELVTQTLQKKHNRMEICQVLFSSHEEEAATRLVVTMNDAEKHELCLWLVHHGHLQFIAKIFHSMLYLYQEAVVNALIAAQEFSAAIPLINLCSERNQLKAYQNLYIVGERDLVVKNVKRLRDNAKQEFCQYLINHSSLEKNPDFQLSSCRSLIPLGSGIHPLTPTAPSSEIYQNVLDIAQTIESRAFLDKLSTFFCEIGMTDFAEKVHESDLS